MTLRFNKSFAYSIFFLIILSACASAPPSPEEKRQAIQRFDNLLELHDLSERAFLYYHFCLHDSETINEKFMANFELTSNLLLDEGMRKMKMPPEFVVQRILNRRKFIQQQLSDHYHSKGCQSEEAMMAAAHYKAYADMSEKQIKRMIN